MWIQQKRRILFRAAIISVNPDCHSLNSRDEIAAAAAREGITYYDLLWAGLSLRAGLPLEPEADGFAELAECRDIKQQRRAPKKARSANRAAEQADVMKRRYKKDNDISLRQSLVQVVV